MEDVREIEITKLKNVPKKATITTIKFLTRIIETASNNKDLIPPIIVGEVDGEYYIIDGHARVSASKKAGITHLKSIVYKLDTIDDVIKYHVRYNKHGTFNPLILYKIIKREELSNVADKYWLDLNQIKTIFALKNVGEKALRKMQYYIDLLSTKFDTIHIPHYIIMAISKVPVEYQEDILDYYIFLDIDKREDRFSFPDADAIAAFVSYYNKPKDEVEIVNNNNNKTLLLENVASKEVKNMVVRGSNITLLECDKCKTKYIVNRKNLRISPIDDKEEMIIVKDDMGKELYAIPPHIIEDLKVSEKSVINWFHISSEEDLKVIRKNLGRYRMAIMMIDENAD